MVLELIMGATRADEEFLNRMNFEKGIPFEVLEVWNGISRTRNLVEMHLRYDMMNGMKFLLHI